MNGYKTGGDWTDVTSIGRNEVVFEGRHKAYGAFDIRKRYSNALLIALLSAVSLVALCAMIPYLARHGNPDVAPPVEVIPSTQIIPYVLPKANPKPITHPNVTPPKPPPPAENTPPLISTTVPDSVPKKKPDEQPIVTNPNPGPGNGKIDNNPGLTGGGGIDHSMPKDTFVLYAGEMPKFKNGDLNSYLAGKISYPSEESELGVQGTVYASFIIERDGSVGEVKLLRGVANGPGLDKEALRVLSEMPKWTPGKQDGHPVRVKYTIPIHFNIK